MVVRLRESLPICAALLSILVLSGAPGREKIVFAAPPNSSPLKYSIDIKLPDVIESRYSDQLYKVLKHRPLSRIPAVTLDNPYWYRAIRTPGETDYIGMVRRMYVDASAEKVASVFEDFENYNKLFDGLIKVNVTETDGNKFTTSWTREPPIFLAANIHYRMIYLIDKTDPSRLVLRYQLKDSNTLKTTDGVIVIESQERGTWVTIFDFFDVNWGVAKTLAPNRIWGDSIMGGLISDLSVKMRVEHQDWTYKRVRSEAAQLAKKSLDPVIYLEQFNFEE